MGAKERELAWPELPYEEWKATKDTLLLYTQVVGKIMLALCPEEPEWGHAALRLTACGLATGPMPCGSRMLEIYFDFEQHVCVVLTSDDLRSRCDLKDGMSVADFYEWVMHTLVEMGCNIHIWTKPQELEDATPLDQDRRHRSYDRDAVNRWFRAQASVSKALAAWLAPYRGPKTRVQWWWGSFDLAGARFSGRPVDVPAEWGVISSYAMDAEEVAVGFWPGDERYPEPALYGYAYPRPEGFEAWKMEPAGAFWSDALGEFVLPYSIVREAEDPHAACLAFFQCVYEAGATLAEWPREQWERSLPTHERRPHDVN